MEISKDLEKAVKINTPVWNIHIWEGPKEIYLGISRVPLTPPTIGLKMSYNGVRYEFIDVKVAVTPNPNNHASDFSTDIVVNVKRVP